MVYLVAALATDRSVLPDWMDNRYALLISYLVLLFAITTLTEMRIGSTLGQSVFSLQVRYLGASERKLRFIYLRNATNLIDIFAFPIAILVAIFPGRKTISDRLSGTSVTRKHRTPYR